MTLDGCRWKTGRRRRRRPALFGADELLVPERGTGRMSDLEFLHVTAKTHPQPRPDRLARALRLDDQRLSRLQSCVYILLRPADARVPRAEHRRGLRPQDRRQDQRGRAGCAPSWPTRAGRARRSRWAPTPIRTSAPRRKYRLTRGVLEALTERAQPVLDPDQVAAGHPRPRRASPRPPQRADVSVNFSIGTLDERVWRATEPGTPHPRRRIEAMAAAVGGRHPHRRAGRADPARAQRPPRAAARGGRRDRRRRRAGARHRRRCTCAPACASTSWTGCASADPDLHADYVRRYAASDYAPARYVDAALRRAGVPRRR